MNMQHDSQVHPAQARATPRRPGLLVGIGLMALLAGSACRATPGVVCADGSLCPDGAACLVDSEFGTTYCVEPSQQTCDPEKIGTFCEFAGVAGICIDEGYCVASFCGDGRVDSRREMCDGDQADLSCAEVNDTSYITGDYGCAACVTDLRASCVADNWMPWSFTTSRLVGIAGLDDHALWVIAQGGEAAGSSQPLRAEIWVFDGLAWYQDEPADVMEGAKAISVAAAGETTWVTLRRGDAGELWRRDVDGTWQQNTDSDLPPTPLTLFTTTDGVFGFSNTTLYGITEAGELSRLVTLNTNLPPTTIINSAVAFRTSTNTYYGYLAIDGKVYAFASGTISDQPETGSGPIHGTQQVVEATRLVAQVPSLIYAFSPAGSAPTGGQTNLVWGRAGGGWGGGAATIDSVSMGGGQTWLTSSAAVYHAVDGFDTVLANGMQSPALETYTTPTGTLWAIARDSTTVTSRRVHRRGANWGVSQPRHVGGPSNSEVLILDTNAIMYSPEGAGEAAHYVGGGGPITAYLEVDAGRYLAFSSIGTGDAQQAVAIILYVVNDRLEPGTMQLIPNMSEVTHAVANTKSRQIYAIGHKNVGNVDVPRSSTSFDSGFNWATAEMPTSSRLVGLATLIDDDDASQPSGACALSETGSLYCGVSGLPSTTTYTLGTGLACVALFPMSIVVGDPTFVAACNQTSPADSYAFLRFTVDWTTQPAIDPGLAVQRNDATLHAAWSSQESIDAYVIETETVAAAPAVVRLLPISVTFNTTLIKGGLTTTDVLLTGRWYGTSTTLAWVERSSTEPDRVSSAGWPTNIGLNTLASVAVGDAVHALASNLLNDGTEYGAGAVVAFDGANLVRLSPHASVDPTFKPLLASLPPETTVHDIAGVAAANGGVPYYYLATSTGLWYFDGDATIKRASAALEFAAEATEVVTAAGVVAALVNEADPLQATVLIKSASGFWITPTPVPRAKAVCTANGQVLAAVIDGDTTTLRDVKAGSNLATDFAGTPAALWCGKGAGTSIVVVLATSMGDGTGSLHTFTVDESTVQEGSAVSIPQEVTHIAGNAPSDVHARGAGYYHFNGVSWSAVRAFGSQVVDLESIGGNIYAIGEGGDVQLTIGTMRPTP
ncbi:MAG: hypothetical protein IPL79_16510 [Myxococcales bacterium]|nr:hypothetical protein [Myxococcales bacterium]